MNDKIIVPAYDAEAMKETLKGMGIGDVEAGDFVAALNFVAEGLVAGQVRLHQEFGAGPRDFLRLATTHLIALADAIGEDWLGILLDCLPNKED